MPILCYQTQKLHIPTNRSCITPIILPWAHTTSIILHYTTIHLSSYPTPALHLSSYTTQHQTPIMLPTPHDTYHPSLPYHTYDLALCNNTPTILPARTSKSTPTQTTALTPVVTTCTCTILITLPDPRSPSIILPTFPYTYHHK